ncbi:MAG: glycoside hydrolase family 5 protein [Treponema sp.]|nr:glycoside hydrolase family 5 protein [Treponema sp.]
MKKSSKIIKFLALAFLTFTLFSSCSSTTKNQENIQENTENIEFQENGLAVLNIKEPLVLDPYPTNHRGDGTFHDAAYIAKDMKIGLNLGNTMEAYEANGCEKNSFTWIPRLGNNKSSDYESCWGAPITSQEMVDGIKAAGFSTVRIPVFWGNMMENDGTWTINPELLDRVREIVDYCLNDDLYAVVNIHHFDEFIIRRNNIEDCQVIFTNLWTQISSYFADYGEKLIFEGFNEYLGGNVFNSTGYLAPLNNEMGYKYTNTMNKAFVEAVRSTGGNNSQRVLIISGLWTNIDRTTAKFYQVPEDSVKDKLMVSVHYVDNSMYWAGKIATSEWVTYIDQQCGLLEKAFTSRGIPVFLGETTSFYPSLRSSQTYKNSQDCVKYVMETLLTKGFVPVLWDTPNNFYNRNEAKIKTSENEKMIKEVAEFAENLN